MGDVSDAIGDVFSSVAGAVEEVVAPVIETVAEVVAPVAEVVQPLLEAVGPVAQVAGPLLQVAGLVSGQPELVLAGQVTGAAGRIAQIPGIVQVDQPPTPEGELSRIFTQFTPFPGFTPSPERPVTVTLAAPTFDIAGMTSLIRELLQQEVGLQQTFLSSLVSPLLAKIVEEVQVVGRLDTTLSTLLTPFVQEFQASAQDARTILLPTVSGAAAALFQIVRAIITGQDLPAESLLQIFREATLFVARIAGPEARLWLPHITRLLTAVLPQVLTKRDRVLSFFDQSEEDLPDSVRFAFTAAPSATISDIPPWLRPILWALTVGISFVAKEYVTIMGQTADALKGPIAATAQVLGNLGLGAVELLHSPMEAVIEGAGKSLLTRLTDRLEIQGVVTPEDVPTFGPKLLATAAGLGMASHLFAVLGESVAFFKQLGLSNFAAVLADLADFRHISRSSLLLEMETGLRTPSLRRARARFRPELPDPVSHAELFLKRLIPDEEAMQYYREHGWREEIIEPHLDALHREPTGFELAFAFEDAELDPAWVLKKLQRRGFKDEDAEKLLAGVRNRALRTLRGKLLTSVASAYEQGVITLEDAKDRLGPLRLREESLQLWVASVSTDRLRLEGTELRADLEAASVAGLFSPEELQSELAALGFDARAQAHAVRRVKIKQATKSFREEQAETKAEVRKVQATRITVALDQHRHFLLDDTDLEQILLGFGIKDEEVRALVALAAIRREPLPRLEEVLSAGAITQRGLKHQADQILILQRNGVIDEQTAVTLLQVAGLDPVTASEEAGLVAAHLTRPPTSPRPIRESPAVRAAREAATHAALARFREGVVSPEGLRALLRAAGNAELVANALVDRELAFAEEHTARQTSRTAEQELRHQRSALEAAAVEAFRRGNLDEPGLLANLVALGRSEELATALVTREMARKAPRVTPTAP